MPPLITIDTFVHLFSTTILHPFPALLTLLSVVALGHSATSTTFSISTVYVGAVTLLYLLQHVDARIASGAPRLINWEDEVVVITGGAGGLGGLIAETYGMRGTPVAVLDVKSLNQDELNEWEDKGVSYYRCDVGDRRQVESTARRVKHDLGTPTILVNNAAVVHGKQLLDLTEQDIDRTYRVNVLSHYHTIQTFFPDMLLRPNGGTIVTVSSVLGYLGCAGLSDYTSSKAALKALHNSLRAELAALAAGAPPDRYPGAIRLVLLMPGQLSTRLFSFITPPSSFFGPTVSVAELAAATVRAVDRGVHAELSMPLYARWIDVMGILPAGLRGLVRRWAGVDRAGWEGAAVLNGSQEVGSGREDKKDK